MFILFVSAAVSLVTFGQSSVSILFMSSLVAVASTVRLGREGAAVSIATIALIGAFMTGMGSGPVYLMQLSLSGQWLMFHFFLAVTVLTLLPVAAEMESRKALLKRIRDSEARFRMLAEYGTDAIIRIGKSGRIGYVSPAVHELTGYQPNELIGRRSSLLVDLRDTEQVNAAYRNAIITPGGAHIHNFRIRRKDGKTRWLEIRARAIALDNEEIELLAIMRDVTDVRQRQAELSRAALTDRLTGLPNRRALQAAAAKLGPGDHCIVLLDLDRFKQVNDTYGHDAGDAVLAGFADVSRRLVRTYDMVARLGGEEFVVVFEHTKIEQAYELCDWLRSVLGSTAGDAGRGGPGHGEWRGFATIGRGGLEASLKPADEALYRDKQGGRDRLLLAA